MSLSSHQSARSKSVTWLTPPELVKRLGPFDTDPCCPPDMPWSTAVRMYTAKGLELPWTGLVWLNPPFGRQSEAWVEKLAVHGQGIALLAARTETEMFFRWVWNKADAVLFLRGRPHFYYADGTRAPFNSGAPIVLAAYGRQCQDRLRRNAELGQYVEGWAK